MSGQILDKRRFYEDKYNETFHQLHVIQEQKWNLENNLRVKDLKIKSLESENARLREALRFYADEKNYVDQESIGNGIFGSPIQLDCGNTALKALGGKQGGER